MSQKSIVNEENLNLISNLSEILKQLFLSAAMLYIQGEREGECQVMLDEMTAKMNQIYNSNPPPLRSRQVGASGSCYII